jgi:hypothetical protein
MRTHAKAALVSLAPVVFIAACAGLGPLVDALAMRTNDDDGNYTIHDVVLEPPPGGGVGTFTVRWRYQQAPGSLGSVAPIVALVDSDGGFRFGADILTLRQVPATNPQFESATFTLSCRDGDVVGDNDGSGEGTADIFARVERVAGGMGARSLGEIEVTCP